MTDVTDGDMDDIVWIQGTMIPWFNARLGHEKSKKEKSIYLIYVLYILYVIYIVYIYMHIIYLIYCIYTLSKVSGISIGLHLQHILWNPPDRWCYG